MSHIDYYVYTGLCWLFQQINDYLVQILVVIGVIFLGLLMKLQLRQKKAQKLPGSRLVRGYCPSCGRSHDGKCYAAR